MFMPAVYGKKTKYALGERNYEWRDLQIYKKSTIPDGRINEMN